MLLIANRETRDELKAYIKDIEDKDEVVHILKWKDGTRMSDFIKQHNVNNEQLRCITDEEAKIELYGENMLIESATANALLYLTLTEFKDSLNQ